MRKAFLKFMVSKELSFYPVYAKKTCYRFEGRSKTERKRDQVFLGGLGYFLFNFVIIFFRLYCIKPAVQHFNLHSLLRKILNMLEKFLQLYFFINHGLSYFSVIYQISLSLEKECYNIFLKIMNECTFLAKMLTVCSWRYNFQICFLISRKLFVVDV